MGSVVGRWCVALLWFGVCAGVWGCAHLSSSEPAQRAAGSVSAPDSAEWSAEDAAVVFDGARSADGALDDDDVVVVRLRFDVERFLVPADAMEPRRGQVWGHVDELRIEPETSALLLRNGFRVGVASRSGGEAIRAIMHELEAGVETMTHLVQSGVPVTLDLGPVGEGRSVFTIGRSGGLAGNTFANASRLLHLDYDVTLADGARTALRITPEIFKESDTPYWQVREGDVRYQKQYEGMVYRELSAELTTGEGDVLVIGPSGATERPLTLGSTMLSDIIAGRRWETLLCVRPRLYRNAGRQGSR